MPASDWAVVAVVAGDPADVAPLAQALRMRGASPMLQQPTPRTDLTVWLADTDRAASTMGAVLTVVGSPFGAAEAPLAVAGQQVVTIDDLRTGPAIDPLHVDDPPSRCISWPQGRPAPPKRCS
jgi:fatty-acyl-CoA synthase